jgi:hypothetical protein
MSEYQELYTNDDLVSFFGKMKETAKLYPHNPSSGEPADTRCAAYFVYRGYEFDSVMTHDDLGEAGIGLSWSIVLSEKHDRGPIPNNLVDDLHKVVFEGRMNMPVGPVFAVPNNPILPHQKHFILPKSGS